MRVCLVNPNWRLYNIPFTTATLSPPVAQPLELAYIAGALKNGFDVQVYDAYATDDPMEVTQDKLKEYKPDVLIYTTAPSYLFWRCPPLDFSMPSLVGKIGKELGTKNIAIGPHGVRSPYTMLERTFADIIVIGEPDLVLPDYLKGKIEEGEQGIFSKDLGFSKAEQVNMAKLPVGFFCFFQMDLYSPHTWSKILRTELLKTGKNFAIVERSRGCPFNCSYCLRDSCRQEFRIKPTERIIGEVKELKDLDVEYVFFIDETFNVNTKDLREFLEELSELGMKFGCQCRADIMREDLLRLMREAGCVYIEYGIDSLEPSISLNVGKSDKNRHINHIVEVTTQLLGKDSVKTYYIDFYSDEIARFLVGENKLEDIDTKTRFESKVIRPYPGTGIGDYIMEKYQVPAEEQWDFCLRYVWWLQVEKILLCEKKTGTEVKYIRDSILLGDFDEAQTITVGILSLYKENIGPMGELYGLP